MDVVARQSLTIYLVSLTPPGTACSWYWACYDTINSNIMDYNLAIDSCRDNTDHKFVSDSGPSYMKKIG